MASTRTITPPRSAEVAHTRAKVAGLSRRNNPHDPDYIEARRDHTAATIADYVQRAVADAPPLTTAQRDRIASILRGGRG